MKKDILLVDDEVITNIVHKLMLEKSSLAGEIEVTSNGREALTYLEEAAQTGRALPDVVFLDLNMPLMNGFQFLDLISYHPSIDRKAMNIVVLSSSFDPRDRVRARELGIEQFIEKPLTTAHIDRYLN